LILGTYDNRREELAGASAEVVATIEFYKGVDWWVWMRQNLDWIITGFVFVQYKSGVFRYMRISELPNGKEDNNPNRAEDTESNECGLLFQYFRPQVHDSDFWGWVLDSEWGRSEQFKRAYAGLVLDRRAVYSKQIGVRASFSQGPGEGRKEDRNIPYRYAGRIKLGL
jgi:hypothetical protein